MSLSEFRIKTCPKSFYYIPNFIDEEKEKYLLNKFYNVPKSKWTYLSHRRLQNWGGLPDLKGMILEDIPEWVNEIMTKINDISIFADNNIQTNHALLNEYQQGEGILPHHDGPLYYPIVATLSLNSHTVLNFYEPQSNDKIIPINERKIAQAFIEPRSLYLMTEDIYSYFMHGIDEALSDLIDVDKFCNMDFLDKKYSSELANQELSRSTRVSFTIRNVPKTVKLSKSFKFR